jgi:rare lipoprotein A
MRRVALLTAAAGLLGACSEAQLALHATKRVEQAIDDPTVSTHGAYKVGNPYAVEGVWYTPREDFAYDETGIASWYGPGFHAKRTANGDIFDQNALTAAHPTLQMPAKVQVTNLENGRSIALVVNDRGPYKRGRILDVSRRAAQLLGFDGNGTARVRVKVLPEESLQMAAQAGRKGTSPTLVAQNNPRLAPPAPAVPREAVAVASLDPVPVPTTAAPSTTVPVAAPALEPAPAAATPVTLTPVHPTTLFIQAGAFTQRVNAERLRSRLAPIGPTQIYEFQQGNQHFYRVRVGPLRSVADADAALGRVVSQGQSDARVVVD